MRSASTPPPLPAEPGPPPLPCSTLPPLPLRAAPENSPPTQAAGLSIKDSAALAGLPRSRMSMGRLILEGELSGRLVQAAVQAVTRNRRAGEVRYQQRVSTRFTLEIPCNCGGRMVLGYHASLGRVVRWVNRRGGLFPVEGQVAGGHLGVWSHEPQWSQRLLADKANQEQIVRLLPAQTPLQALAIQVYPDRLIYTCLGTERGISDQFGEWVQAGLRLAVRLEEAPRPATQHQPGWMERHPILLAVLLIGGFLVLCIVGALLLVGLAVVIAG